MFVVHRFVLGKPTSILYVVGVTFVCPGQVPSLVMHARLSPAQRGLTRSRLGGWSGRTKK